MLRKQVLFWLVWLPTAPFVLLYYIGTALRSGRWSTIWLKTTLVYQGVREKLVKQKPKQRVTLREYDYHQNPIR